MDKRERKTRLMEIIEMVNECIVSVSEYDAKYLNTAKEKIDDLEEHLQLKSLMPQNFDAVEMFQDIMIDYFNNDDSIVELIGIIENFTDEVREHIEEMNDGVRKEEWEEFFSNLECIEDALDINANGIEDVEGYEDALIGIKNTLEDLI